MPFAFGDCVLDENCFDLRRRGKTVRLEPKVFDVLLHLIVHRDRVVTKHELLDTLWGGEAVSDSVLPRCIAAMRRAVGDNRTRQRVIATAHGRGYRFVARLKEVETEARPSATSKTEETEHASTATAFVGRTDPLARAIEALDRTARGNGGVALVVGEPGIGKTRLTEEIAGHARARGFEVGVGRCYEGEGAPPYWPWVQILRDAAASESDETLRAQLGAGAAELAELVPELRGRLTDLGSGVGPGGEQARFRLFDAATQFFKARAKAKPLLLILDDLHWGDASSLGLLRFLARPACESRILILGTYRDVDVRRGHPLADLLGALAREARCERIHLSGLSEDEIADLVSIVAGQAPRSDLVQKLREMTEGNPFFLLEMVRLLAEQGATAELAPEALSSLTLPQGVKDAIGRRLDSLSSECNAMLRAAAVIGRSFRSQILEDMLDLPEEQRSEAMLELLAEALDAGAIVEAERGVYAFAHALTRQTLYEELRAPTRITLHRRAGQALELGLDAVVGREEQLVELARHFFEAAPGGDVDKAAAYLVAAAKASDRKYAYDEAVTFYERALETLALRVPMDDERRAETQLALGEAQFVAGKRDPAMATLHAVANLARTLGRVDLMAKAAIAIRGFGELGSEPDEGVEELLKEAFSKLPEEELSLRSRLTSRLNGVSAHTMDERVELAQRAFDLAQRSGDPIALRDALSARWWSTLGPDRVAERAEVATALKALALETDDPRTFLLSFECELGMHMVRGDRAATERALDDFDRVAAQIRQPIFVFMGMNYRTSWLISRGHFREAEARVERARAFGQGVVPYVHSICEGQLYWSRASQGLNPEVLLTAEEVQPLMLGTFMKPAVSKAFLAMLAYSTDRDAARSCEVMRSIDYKQMERDEHWLLVTTGLAAIAADAADLEICKSMYESLSPYADLIAIHDLLRAGLGSVASSLGLLAWALGDLDGSVAHYEEALEREGTADMLTAVAASQLALARVLRDREAAGDLERAEELIRVAVETCRDLGLGPGSRERRLLGRLGEEARFE